MPPPFLVTPAEIKALDPCVDRWSVYRKAHPDDAAHPLADVIDSNGLDDCLWVLDRLPSLDARRARTAFAAWCAESVLHLFEQERPNDSRPREAIAAARRWVKEPTADNAAASDAARDAARDAAWAAASATAWAAASATAWAAARDAARAAAWAAAWDAAWAAAMAAAWAAAGDAASDAAGAAARERQAVALRALLDGEDSQ